MCNVLKGLRYGSVILFARTEVSSFELWLNLRLIQKILSNVTIDPS